MRKIDWAAIRALDWPALGGIALRNVVPVAGMIVSGFGAGEIVLLYYVDTLASIATVFALIFMYAKVVREVDGLQLDPARPADAAKIVFLTAFLTAVFAFVCAIPMVVAAAVSDLDWKSEELRVAVLVQLLFASTGFLGMSREIRATPQPDARLKARFAYVFARWIAVFAVCTTIYWPPVLVLTYVVASVWLEFRPLPPDDPVVPQPVRADTQSIPRRKSKKRR